MTRLEYRKARQYHRQLSRLLKFAYTIQDRDTRIRAVATIQTKLSEIGA